MGASASVVKEVFPDDIKPIFELCERLKHKIAEKGAAQLAEEVSHTFKKHSRIIALVTGRTKIQLQTLMHVAKSDPENMAKFSGGGHYAKFIKSLFHSKDEIEMEMLKHSAKEYDEDLLVTILGTSTTQEIKLFVDAYKREKHGNLADLIVSRTEKGSNIQALLLRVVNFNRSESKKVDIAKATHQAAEIHRAGAAKLRGVDEDTIFDMFCKISRAQCVAIGEEYLRMYKIKVERAMGMKFKGNTLKLLNLLIQPAPKAVASVLYSITNRLLIDTSSLCYVLAKYDKDFLEQVSESCEKVYNSKLFDFIKKGLSGNLAKAVKGWIENNTPDGGYERGLIRYMEDNHAEGRKQTELATNPLMNGTVKALLEKQSSLLVRYLEDNNIAFSLRGARVSGEEKEIMEGSFKKAQISSKSGKLDEETGRFLKAAIRHAAVGAGEDAEGAAALYSEESIANKDPLLESKLKRATTIANKIYKDKSAKVYDFLAACFELYDPEDTGVFEAEEFWEVVVKKLPLVEMGFTAEEVGSMRDWCEWDHEGMVTYYDILYEFSDVAISTIEGRGKDVLATIDSLEGWLRKQMLQQADTLANDSNYISSTHTSLLAGVEEEGGPGEGMLPAAPLTITGAQSVEEIAGQNDNSSVGFAASSDYNSTSIHGTTAAVGERFLSRRSQMNLILSGKSQASGASSGISAGEGGGGELLSHKMSDATAPIFANGNSSTSTSVGPRKFSAPGGGSSAAAAPGAGGVPGSAGPGTVSEGISNVTSAAVVAARAKRRMSMSEMYFNVPLNLLGYLYDTFHAYDTDMDGCLSFEELAALLQDTGIGLTADLFLPEPDQLINMKAAVELFTRTLAAMFADESDHYICLIDKPTGAYFWYNTKDESTQWATFEGEGTVESGTEGESAQVDALPSAILEDEAEREGEGEGDAVTDTESKSDRLLQESLTSNSGVTAEAGAEADDKNNNERDFKDGDVGTADAKTSDHYPIEDAKLENKSDEASLLSEERAEASKDNVRDATNTEASSVESIGKSATNTAEDASSESKTGPGPGKTLHSMKSKEVFLLMRQSSVLDAERSMPPIAPSSPSSSSFASSRSTAPVRSWKPVSGAAAMAQRKAPPSVWSPDIEPPLTPTNVDKTVSTPVGHSIQELFT